MKRRDARELAFILLFEQSFTNDPVDELIASAERNREAQFDDFSRRLCGLVAEHREEIDAKISRYATRWGLGRLPRVTVTLLRLCMSEMDYMDDVPVGVSINEAVELCKTYAGEEDASFLNGVLGAYAKGDKVSVDLPVSNQPDVLPGDQISIEEEEPENTPES